MARVDSIAGRTWLVLRTTTSRALEERAPEAAASVGFFAVFSLFPLLLILVAVSSTLLSNLHTQEQVLASVLRFVPVSRELVSANLRVVLKARGAMGAIGLAGLLWSATSALAVLVRNLNMAWPTARVRSALGSRLIALALVGGLTGMAVLFLAAKAVPSLAANWSWLAGVLSVLEQTVDFAWRATIITMIFGAMVLLYRLVPAASVRWPDAAVGAAAATGAFAAATAGFTWYLDSGFAQYNLVYGSLGTLVALLGWIYLLSLIVLLGAHFCASLELARAAAVTDGAANGEDVTSDEARTGPKGRLGIGVFGESDGRSRKKRSGSFEEGPAAGSGKKAEVVSDREPVSDSGTEPGRASNEEPGVSSRGEPEEVASEGER